MLQEGDGSALDASEESDVQVLNIEGLAEFVLHGQRFTFEGRKKYAQTRIKTDIMLPPNKREAMLSSLNSLIEAEQKKTEAEKLVIIHYAQGDEKESETSPAIANSSATSALAVEEEGLNISGDNACFCDGSSHSIV